MYTTSHTNYGETIITVREDADDQVLASFLHEGGSIFPLSPRKPREALINAALRKAGKGTTFEQEY